MSTIDSLLEIRYLIILRGTQGSGKSTYAQRFKQIACGLAKVWSHDKHHINISPAFICSADDYFIRPDGVYEWSHKTIKNAHEWCFNNFNEAIEEKYKFIILDNTNAEKKQFQHYIDAAEKAGYTVVERRIGVNTEENLKLYANRNIHGVPYETVKNTWKKLQRDTLNELTELSEADGDYFQGR